MTFLDLCAGIGGFSLGLERAGMTCAGQVEIDDYCNRILAKHWPHVPRWGDITTLDAADLPAVDLICGGYPCQPFSHAGKRKGAGDDRHLWPDICEIVAHIRPTWCLFENVAGHITLGLDAVLSDLERLGYASGLLVIPACAVDAPHRRDRVWILGHTPSAGLSHGGGPQVDEQGTVAQPERSGCSDVSHSDGKGRNSGATSVGREAWRIPHRGCARLDTHPHSAGLQKQHTPPIATGQGHGAGASAAHWHQWPVEPAVGRVAHGIPRRVDRLRALGNAVVPQVVEEIGRAIMAAHSGEE